jgi:hypothetical protein
MKRGTVVLVGAKAEELFGRSFAGDPENLYNTVKAAGSYVKVVPN